MRLLFPELNINVLCVPITVWNREWFTLKDNRYFVLPFWSVYLLLRQPQNCRNITNLIKQGNNLLFYSLIEKEIGNGFTVFLLSMTSSFQLNKTFVSLNTDKNDNKLKHFLDELIFILLENDP